MPAILTALGALLLRIAGSLVGRVLLALGLTYVTMQGADVMLQSWMDSALSQLSQVDEGVLPGMLEQLRVVDALSVISSSTVSAVALRASIAGATRLVHK